jgi:hypothetical protein
MTGWRARFFDESPLYDPIRGAAALFAGCSAFPTPEEIDEALRARAGVRFVRQRPREAVLYDARIVNEGAVPTRHGSWHDFLNALVWATFPRAKSALHRRQHAIVVPGAPRRTTEGDALAMLDEGGVFRLCSGELRVFGHAIYEGRVLGRRALAAGLELTRDGDVDELAAARIADPQILRSPAELSRVELDSLERDTA